MPRRRASPMPSPRTRTICAVNCWRSGGSPSPRSPAASSWLSRGKRSSSASRGFEEFRRNAGDEFARRLAMAPEEEVDEGTTARIFAAEAEQGEIISHGDLKQRLIL